jgi:NitT/TauT family transport system permease protein
VWSLATRLIFLIDNARMLGASKGQLALHVLIPSALSWVFRVSTSVWEWRLSQSWLESTWVLPVESAIHRTSGGCIRYDRHVAGTALLAIVVLIIGAIVTWVQHKLVSLKAAPDRTSTAQLP